MHIQKLGNQPSFQSIVRSEDVLKYANPEDVSRYKAEMQSVEKLLEQASETSLTYIRPLIRNGRIREVEVNSTYEHATTIKDDLCYLGKILLDSFVPPRYLDYEQSIKFKDFTGKKLLETVRSTTQGAIKRFGTKK